MKRTGTFRIMLAADAGLKDMTKLVRIITLLALAQAALPAAGQLTNVPPAPVIQAWGGGRHTIALLADGSVWDWGSDVSGKLGDNNVSPSYNVTNGDSFLPVRVHGPGNFGYLTNVMAISAGEGHNMALKADGTVWTWGWNGLAQLGDGTTNDAHTPVQVVGLTNVVAISGRGYFCLAQKSDGTVWSWGWNQYGQLGINSLNTTLVPVQILGLTNPASISAGYSIGLALMSNGTVEVWGTSKDGDLGEGSLNDHSYVPEVVNGLSNVVTASAGFQNPEVLKSDGTIWMWGYGTWGQLGNSGLTNSPVPVQVTGLTNMIFAGPTGDRDNCAIGADHTVWTWGRNYDGQLGNGTASQVFQDTPVQTSPFGNGAYPVMVQTPDWHSLALCSDGTLWAWGSDDHGQLGNNSTNEQWSPGAVMWRVVPPATIKIAAGKRPDGSFQLVFTNNPGARFTVLTSTSLLLPLSQWTPASGVTEDYPGQFQFTDMPAASAQRYYRVRSP